MRTVFALVNVGIFLGYAMIAWFVVPSLNIRYRLTKYGGAAFFALCAATHVELGVHGFTGTSILVEDFTSWHMMLIHIPQFLAVWLFTAGLYKEVSIAGPYLRLDKTSNILRNMISEIENLKPNASAEDVRLLDEALASVRQVERNLSD